MTDTIDIYIEGRYRSISDLEWLNVPPFAVITGVNGSGKSQLLEVIAHHSVQRNTPARYLQAPWDSVRSSVEGVSYERGEIFHSYNNWIMPAQGEVTERQIREAIENLHRQLTQDNYMAFQAGIPWFFEQLGITAEDARNLSLNELYGKLTPGLLYGLMSRTGESVNGSPLYAGWAFLFFAYRLFERDALAADVPKEEIRRRFGEPPWVLLNETLETSGLPFRVMFPEGPIRPSTLVYDTTFQLRLQDIELGVEVPYEGLSSGEKVIMSTVLWRYEAQLVGRHPRFLLLDEPDAHLHPSLTRRFLDVIQKVFVKERGVRVIMTTHSPSTVSLAPEESLFEMRRTNPRIQPATSKARAVALLTDGFVTVQEATQTVLLEGKDDPPFYELVWDLLTERSSVSEPGPLEPFPGVAFLYGKGKDTVEELVPQMRAKGLKSFHGIIDKDVSNVPSDGVYVIGRNGMENYLYDPLNVWVLLRSQGQDPTVAGVHVPRGRDAHLRDLPDDRLQEIADVVLALAETRLTGLAAQETTREDVRFANGKVLQYPRWFLYRDDKEIQRVFSDAYGYHLLKPNNTEHLLRSYAILNMVPMDFLDLFRVIQASGNPE